MVTLINPSVQSLSDAVTLCGYWGGSVFLQYITYFDTGTWKDWPIPCNVAYMQSQARVRTLALH